MSRRLMLIAVAVGVAACSGGESSVASSPDATSPTTAHAAIIRPPSGPVAVDATALDLLPATLESAGALLLHYREWSIAHGGWSEVLTPLDAASGADVSGYAGIDVGFAPRRSISPDGRLMAVTSRSSPMLRVYDLGRWEIMVEIELMPKDGVAVGAQGWGPDWSLAWTADGARVFAMRDHCTRPAAEGRCVGDWERDLWVADLAAETFRQVASFSFSPMSLHVPEGGDRAYVLGLRTNVCCGIEPEGDPFVAVVDVSEGRVIGEVVLPGTLLGQTEHRLGDASVYGSYWPRAALAPDGTRLYVVDAADDRVTVVDLERLEIEQTVDLEEAPSAVSRFGGWLRSLLVTEAQAKGGPSYHRVVEVTPDGRHLLVSGQQSHATDEGDDGDPLSYADRPAGLTVIDTETWSVVLRVPDVGDFDLSGGGRWVVGTGWSSEPSLYDENGFGGSVGHGLRLVDLDALEEVAHLWRDESVSLAAISPDGRYAYVIRDGPGLQTMIRERISGPCPAECHQVEVLDILAGEVVAERMLDGGYGIGPLKSGSR